MKISRTILIFLISAVLVFGTTISMGIPTTAFAQSYGDSYAKDKKSTGLNKQKVNCNNIIINGIDSTSQGSGGDMINDMTNGQEDWIGQQDDQWIGNNDEKNSNGINKNIVNFCKNKNTEVVLAPEPQIGSLTVKKEIFGCVDNNPDDGEMNCLGLNSGSEDWLSCDDPNISNTDACLNLQENFFDIEVLDDQNNQISEFTGSQQGETITNLEPGTQYTVNEIRQPIPVEDQLIEFEITQQNCNGNDFPEGGNYFNSDVSINYNICFEYEDEQGEDCTTNTIAASEDKTCIVKNYISFAAEAGG
ncbi:MAG: hypothetical protein MRJ93_12975 [Nitrososphaeraceae archaeon]|nr:hypothetical protein [Nitrososphaeraceae archaeon]